MRFISLFSGIGGFDLGLERAGMHCIGQVEIDPYCRAVLECHWPDVKRIGDIYDVAADTFEKAELVCGGFPCQPFSFAGKQRGQNDDRYLWPEMLRIVRTYRPAWVLGENVIGIVGMELDKVLADLESEGYRTQPFIIPACAVDAPHERKRVWIVAHAEIGAERSGLCADEPGRIGRGRSCDGGGENIMAHAALMRVERIGESRFGQSGGLAEEIVSDRCCEGIRTAQWEPEPDVGRLADGIPYRVAQLRALGNAVVPQIVEMIGHCIMKIENRTPTVAGEVSRTVREGIFNRRRLSCV